MLVTCLAALPASSAFAGNLFATGHDLDFHCASGSQCGYVKSAVDFARAGAPDPTKPVLILDNASLAFPTALTNAYGAGAAPPSVVMDPSSPAFATTPLTTSLYSAILIASDASCGGCDLNQTGTADSDAINARTADIAAFFNAGGGLLYGSGASHGSGGADSIYYNSAPLPLGGVPVSPPFTLTSAGTTFGLTDVDANCCPTHNSFTTPPAGSSLTVAETDSAGATETLFSSGTIVGGNIFTLKLAPATATIPVGTSHTTTATLSDKSGVVPGKGVLFSVTGVNPTTGSGTTNASGQTTFTYAGASAGTDTITACADLNGGGTCDSGEPTATAAVTWTTGTTAGPPTASIVTPVSGATYTFGQSVHASYSCAAGTGGTLQSCTGPVATGSLIDTTTTGSHTFKVTATDTDTQTGTATSTYTVKAAPPTALIVTPPDGAVYTVGDDVHAAYSCTAGGGGTLQSCAGTVPPDGLINTSTAGSHTLTVTATDTDGQTSSAAATYTVRKAATHLSAPPLILKLGGHGFRLALFEAHAKLTFGAAHEPLAGETITFTAGSTVLCTAVTDAHGRATCAYHLGGLLAAVLNGPLRYRASFAGDANYLPSSITRPVIEALGLDLL